MIVGCMAVQAEGRASTGVIRLMRQLRALPRLFGVLQEPLHKVVRVLTIVLLNPMLQRQEHHPLLDNVVDFVMEQSSRATQMCELLASLPRECQS